MLAGRRNRLPGNREALKVGASGLELTRKVSLVN
jgi:hypothetical protein